MNDETTKELEDLSTLACSTDEGQRRRALVAMLARVVGRASQVDTLPAEEAARVGVLEANLRKVTQQRDTHKADVETLVRDLAEVRAELAKTTEERDAALDRCKETRAEVERLRSPEKAGRALTVEEFEDLAHASRLVFEHWDGDIMASHRAMFRWMEREGYLSVRLPPEE